MSPHTSASLGSQSINGGSIAITDMNKYKKTECICALSLTMDTTSIQGIFSDNCPEDGWITIGLPSLTEIF